MFEIIYIILCFRQMLVLSLLENDTPPSRDGWTTVSHHLYMS